jgi:hypothetical protein
MLDSSTVPQLYVNYIFSTTATFINDGKAIENFLQVRRPAFLAMGPTFGD